MQDVIFKQLETHFPTQQHFLIGLSGGVDSVVLLHLFAQYPALNLRAVHIHHGLSPHAGDWAEFCRHYCDTLGIPLVIRRVTVDGKQGLEANARQARYQAIGELIQPNEVFVTAHHLDDQAESFFLALKRGSGLLGLAGMQAVGNWQNFAIFRPLLGISKREILDYAEHQQLRWIIDESNADNRFDRNFLRNQILPELNQRFGQFSQMVARAAQHCAEQQSLIEELLHDELAARMPEKSRFSIDGFEHCSPLKQQQLLRLWLAKNNVPMPSQVQLQAVISELIFANVDKQPQIKLGKMFIRRYQTEIFLCANEIKTLSIKDEIPLLPSTEKIMLPDLSSLERSEHGLTFCKKSREMHRLQLPAELHTKTLIIRFGVTGKVKQYRKPYREEMKKIWQKNSVPPWERASTPLLFWEEWLVAVLI